MNPMLTRTEREFIKSLGPEGERIWADIAHWVVAHRAEESDRAVAILGASMLEDALESALRRALVEHSVTRGLFGRQGPLATFAAKSDMAFAMGVLSEWEWRDLDRIRRVRNHFAHALRARSFDEQPASQLCDALFMAEFRRGRTARKPDRRAAFTATCGLLAALLSGTRSKRPKPSPFEAIRRHCLAPPPPRRSRTAVSVRGGRAPSKRAG